MAVVTGGARGLGLVMSQACVISGADVAIVDLNSQYIDTLAVTVANNMQRTRASARLRSS